MLGELLSREWMPMDANGKYQDREAKRGVWAQKIAEAMNASAILNELPFIRGVLPRAGYQSVPASRPK
jgi:hypothetical protein